MEQSNPRDGDAEVLKRLQAHLDRASGAAGSRMPPPAGWQAPGGNGEAAGHDGDLDVLAVVLHSMRDLIPPELQRRLTDALRELLLALRALIDWYLERVERRRAAPTEVQDIPIL